MVNIRFRSTFRFHLCRRSHGAASGLSTRTVAIAAASGAVSGVRQLPTSPPARWTGDEGRTADSTAGHSAFFPVLVSGSKVAPSPSGSLPTTASVSPAGAAAPARPFVFVPSGQQWPASNGPALPRPRGLPGDQLALWEPTSSRGTLPSTSM